MKTSSNTSVNFLRKMSSQNASSVTMPSRSVPPTALLFVSDFPLSITDSEIESVFQDFGDVISVQSKRDFFVCYAYVEMESVIEGFRAIECLDGLPVRDKVIRCLQIGIRFY